MQVLTTNAALADWVDAKRKTGTIGLVPTMGFLHQGHQSLMEELRPHVDVLIVSIFVNPLQFGPGEDLDTYPRDLDGDTRLAIEAGVDAIFSPVDFYPSNFATAVKLEDGELTNTLCGADRPGHFDGVCTVVSRLFGLTRCDVAIFGEKDYQQLQVIRRMTEDLALSVEVMSAPLVRDADGVALSSRNAYLSAPNRARARTLSQALFRMATSAQKGVSSPELLISEAKASLDIDALDYLEIVDPKTLSPVVEVNSTCRALVAAQVGGTRLIDNIALVP